MGECKGCPDIESCEIDFDANCKSYWREYLILRGLIGQIDSVSWNNQLEILTLSYPPCVIAKAMADKTSDFQNQYHNLTK